MGFICWWFGVICSNAVVRILSTSIGLSLLTYGISLPITIGIWYTSSSCIRECFGLIAAFNVLTCFFTTLIGFLAVAMCRCLFCRCYLGEEECGEPYFVKQLRKYREETGPVSYGEI